MSVMTCNDAHVLIVRTIDDARLSGEERAALRRHLVSCARCCVEYQTQHEVRRLLVLHIHDRLPMGVAERLSARLARTSRPLPPGVIRVTPAAFATPRRPEVDGVWRRDTRGRMWALRLLPLAATLALIVAGAAVRDDAPPHAVLSEAPSGRPSGVQPGQPRAFTTIVLQRHDGRSRRDRPSPVSTDDVARSLAQPLVDDGHPHETGAAADSGTAVEHASSAAKEVPGTSGISDLDRVPASEPRGQDRERVASRGRDASHARAGGERAASQRQGTLLRPIAPFPPARPAMPAPPAVVPDRSIPPP